MPEPSPLRSTRPATPSPAAIRLALAALAALAACTDPKPSPADSASGADVTTSVDAADVSAVDTDSADTIPWQPSCPGGIGCACTTPTDCDAPLCLETPGGPRCSA